MPYQFLKELPCVRFPNMDDARMYYAPILLFVVKT
jgi:hypothetical protein